MADYKIEWIDKPGGSQNPRTRIERVGGSFPNEWEDTSDHVIQLINANAHRFYVRNGEEASWVEVDYRNSVPYLRTESDHTPIDNLLYLPNVSTQ